jgi:hypothetical protein
LDRSPGIETLSISSGFSGALIYFIGSGSNDWDPNRMSATEYIGAIAFGALLFYFITNSRDDVEETYKPNRTIIPKT